MRIKNKIQLHKEFSSRIQAHLNVLKVFEMYIGLAIQKGFDTVFPAMSYDLYQEMSITFDLVSKYKSYMDTLETKHGLIKLKTSVVDHYAWCNLLHVTLKTEQSSNDHFAKFYSEMHPFFDCAKTLMFLDTIEEQLRFLRDRQAVERREDAQNKIFLKYKAMMVSKNLPTE